MAPALKMDVYYFQGVETTRALSTRVVNPTCSTRTPPYPAGFNPSLTRLRAPRGARGLVCRNSRGRRVEPKVKPAAGWDVVAGAGSLVAASLYLHRDAKRSKR